MADQQETNVGEQQQVETNEQQPDYKAMYEAAAADVEKYKGIARHQEAKYKEAVNAQQDTSERDALQAEVDSLKAKQQRREWVDAAIAANGLTSADARWLTGETEDDIAESARALGERIAAQPKTPDMGNVGGQSKPPMTKADILSIKDRRERMEAIAQNKHLF